MAVLLPMNCPCLECAPLALPNAIETSGHFVLPMIRFTVATPLSPQGMVFSLRSVGTLCNDCLVEGVWLVSICWCVVAFWTGSAQPSSISFMVQHSKGCPYRTWCHWRTLHVALWGHDRARIQPLDGALVAWAQCLLAALHKSVAGIEGNEVIFLGRICYLIQQVGEVQPLALANCYWGPVKHARTK